MTGHSNSQFVKDGARDQQEEPEVNKWGVYNAYK